MQRPDLRAELLRLRDRDRAARAKLAATGELFAGYAAEMERVHAANAERLAEVFDEHGWPGLALVGDDGAEAAWLVAQHAIGLPDFQRRCLRLLTDAVARGAAPAAHQAYLVDRIRFNQRRPQVYGTVFDWDRRGRMSPWTIEDPAGVEARRRDVGLPPLRDTVDRIRRETAAEDHRPPDFAVRQREIEQWSRRVGWIT